MIEATLLLMFGGALARAMVWPLQLSLQERREQRDRERAEEIVARIHDRARRARESAEG